jgi:hypothetical protein
MPKKFVALTIAIAGLFALASSAAADVTLTLPGIL